MVQKTHQQIPQTGFLRLPQILGDKKTNTPPLIPISRTSFLSGVKAGKFPAPVRLGKRIVAWKVSDILALIEKLGA